MASQYRPVLEDWLCHAIVPPIALFGVGAVVVVFLAIGLHNAWDIVTYVTFSGGYASNEQSE